MTIAVMDNITDPRIRAIMAKLNSAAGSVEPSEAPTELEKPESTKPPLTLDEFLKAEKLDEWPQHITSESLLDLKDERELLGSKDMILEELQKATMLDMGVLHDLESRLRGFEDRINAVADKMVVDPQELMENGSPMPMSISRAFLTETKENDMIKVHPSRKKKKSDFKDTVFEARKRSVDYCSFPGYRKGELTELPGQLEAPQILNRITKAQDFNPGFKKFWKKIFQSEASVAMMQDSFWWFFIQNFEKKQREDQNKLFNRIADSFVALFTSVHPEVKDKIFSGYSNCLSQAVFVAFKEAFPESERHFQDEFKQQLVNTTSEWVTGVKCSGNSWKKWDIERLQLRSHKPVTESKASVTNNVRDMAILQKDVKQSLDLSDFQRSMMLLGARDQRTDMTSASQGRLPAITVTNGTAPEVSKATGGALVPVSTTTDSMMVIQKSTDSIMPKKKMVQSSKIGPGPEIERVLFNLNGQSPLVAHFLHMRQLRTNKQPGRKIRRTQIVKESEETRTYQDLIRETTAVQDTMSKDYRRICGVTQSEILKIEKQQRETSRKIENLQKEINNCRNSLEIRLKGDSMLESRDWDTGGFGTQAPTELKALMKKDREEED